MYEIITFGNGEILKGVFDALATCLRSDSGTLYAPLIRVSLIIGGLWAALYAISGDTIKAITHWIIPMTLIMQLLFVPQVSVLIRDPVNHYHQTVDHVPYGLAMAASHISKIGYLLTEQIEKIFHLPDDLKYQKTGTLFASQIILQSKSFRIMNEELAENMRQFVGQCVVYDVLLGRKYSIEELRHSPKIWELISTQASPVRSFLWRDLTQGGKRGSAKIITCQEGVSHLNAAFSYEINTVARTLGKKLFGQERPIQTQTHEQIDGQETPIQTQIHRQIDVQQEFMRYLPLAYSELTRLSGTAEELLKQNMMIYAVVDGLEQQSVRVGNAPNFAVRRAYLQQRSTYETLGAMAAETLPSMKAVLEAIAYSAFLFVIPLALLPFGWRFLSSWLQVLVWLQMWAPLYAILNYMMTIAARSKSMAALSLSNSAGVTIANSVGLVNVNADIAAMTGYLSLSIPFLCIAVVKGLGSFVQMASSLGQVTQSAGTQAAHDAFTGNYSFGNVSSGGRQISNTQMLNQSYGASYRSGSFHQADGRTEVTTSSDGQQIINMSSSNLPLHLNVSKGLIDQKLEQSARSYQNSLQKNEAYFESRNEAFRQSGELVDHLSHSLQLNKNTGKGTTLDESKAAHETGQSTTDVGQTNTMMEQRLAQVLAAIGVSTKGATTENVPVEDGSVVGQAAANIGNTGDTTQAPAKGGAKKWMRLPKLNVVKELLNAMGIDADAKINLSADAQKQDAYSRAERLLKSKDFQEAYRKAEQMFQNESLNTVDDKGKRLMENIHKAWDEANGFKSEANKSLRASEDYQGQASYIGSNGSVINANLNQGFGEWLINQPSDNAGIGGRLGIDRATQILNAEPKLAMQYADRYLSEKGFVPQKSKEIPEDMEKTAKSNYENESRHAIVSVDKENALKKIENLKVQGQAQGLKPVIDEGLVQEFNEKQTEIQNKIANQQKTIDQEYQEKMKKHEEQSRKSLPLVAAKQQLLHVWDVGTHAFDFAEKGVQSVSEFIQKFTDPKNDLQNEHEDEKTK